MDTDTNFSPARSSRHPYGGKSLQSILFRFSAPAVIGIIVSALYNVADRAFIGHNLGPDGIAGVTVTFPLSIFIMACGICAGVGGSVLFSISLGRKDYVKAERVLGNTFSLLLSALGAVALVWYFNLEALLKLLGASKTVMPYAFDYMRVLLIGAPVQGVAMGMNGMLRALGRPKTAMATMIVGAVMNFILGPLFIFGFGWGMKGAALGVVLSQCVSAAWVLRYFIGSGARFKILPGYMLPDFGIIKQILSIGSSQFVMQTAICILNIFLNITLVRYGGDIAVSAMGIVTSVNTLTIMPVIGIAQGAQPVMGYYYGARYKKRLAHFLRASIFWATVVTTVSFLIIMLFAPLMVKVFNNTNRELMGLASRALRIFNLFVPLVGFQVLASTFFQATAKPVKAVVLTLSRQILVLLPLIIILPLFMGLNGVFTAGPAADLSVSALTYILLRHELKKYLKTEK